MARTRGLHHRLEQVLQRRRGIMRSFGMYRRHLDDRAPRGHQPAEAPSLRQRQFNAIPPTGFASWWLRSATANGRDLLDSPFEVSWGTSDITGVVLTFSDRHTQLSGTVMTSADLPASESTVVVFPVDRALWNPVSRRLAAARPATDGRFVFRDLPPGDYYVAPVRDLGGPEWRVPERLEPLVPASVRIRLGQGETKRRDLSVH